MQMGGVGEMILLQSSAELEMQKETSLLKGHCHELYLKNSRMKKYI